MSMPLPGRVCRVTLLFLVCLAATTASAQYAVGTVDMTFVDPDRNNRPIAADVYYPAVSAGPGQTPATPPAGGFPAVVFGHGYLMPASVYAWVGQRLAAVGCITALPRTGGELFPSHAEFALDLAFVGRALRTLSDNPDSPFYGRLNDLAATMGHSMGGGCSLLAAAGDPIVSAVANFAAAETNPSAVAACGQLAIPALLFAGTNDCVTPPPDHQLPMFEALNAGWRTLITLTGASHCQFAASNFACSLGEFCTADITRQQQQNLVWLLLEPWVRAVLLGEAGAAAEFQTRLETTPGSSYLQAGGPTSAPSPLGSRDFGLTAAPNPFNPATVLTIRLDRADLPRVVLFDLAGRRVRELCHERRPAGPSLVHWDGRDDGGREVPAGVYLARLEVDGHAVTTQLALVR